MTATATLLQERLGGYAGIANLYRLHPPLDGEGHVVVWVQDYGAPEAVIVAAHPSGAARKMSRMPGSYVHPKATHAKALSLAGDYEIVVPEPEPEIIISGPEPGIDEVAA